MALAAVPAVGLLQGRGCLVIFDKVVDTRLAELLSCWSTIADDLVVRQQ